MEPNEFRVLIKHYYMKGKTVSETNSKLIKYYGKSAPALRTVYKWYNEFRCGRRSTIDAERSGRPIRVTTQETIQKVHDMITNDGTLKVREIAKVVGISSDRVHNILHEHLHLKKSSSGWIPAEQNSEIYDQNPQEFLHCVLTVDETKTHYLQSGPKKYKVRSVTQDNSKVKLKEDEPLPPSETKRCERDHTLPASEINTEETENYIKLQLLDTNTETDNSHDTYKTKRKRKFTNETQNEVSKKYQKCI